MPDHDGTLHVNLTNQDFERIMELVFLLCLMLILLFCYRICPMRVLVAAEPLEEPLNSSTTVSNVNVSMDDQTGRV